MGLAHGPVPDLEGDVDGPIAHPAHQGPEKGLPLRQVQQRVHHLPVQQLEIRGPAHVDAGGAAHQRVEAPGRQTVGRRFRAPVRLDAVDHGVALLPEPDHLRQLLRRVLEITVDHGAAGALGIPEPGEDGGLLAEVPGEAQTPGGGVFPVGGLDLGPGAVPGAVIHKDQFIFDVRLGQNRPDGLRRGQHQSRLVIAGNDDGQHGQAPFLK